MPAPPWTRCAVSSNAATAPSRACAGRCSRSLAAVGGGRGDLDALIARMTTLRTPVPGLQGAAARDPRAQADQRRAYHAAALVHLCHALQGRADEGGPPTCTPSLGRHRRLGADPTDQRLLEALKWAVQAAKRRARGFTRIVDHPHVIFLIAGKLDFRRDQSSCLTTHLKFNRALFSLHVRLVVLFF